jgi:hypothetical protein
LFGWRFLQRNFEFHALAALSPSTAAALELPPSTVAPGKSWPAKRSRLNPALSGADVLALCAAGLAVGRSLAMIGFLQDTMGLCHDGRSVLGKIIAMRSSAKIRLARRLQKIIESIKVSSGRPIEQAILARTQP